jgi:hypothetical protein
MEFLETNHFNGKICHLVSDSNGKYRLDYENLLMDLEMVLAKVMSNRQMNLSSKNSNPFSKSYSFT